MTQTTNKYYKVVAKCGHVGKNKYVPVAFAVYAESGSAASQLVRTFPRVKKQLSDAIISCEEIDRKTYKQLRKENRNNPYLKCKCHADQIAIANFEEEILYNFKEKRHRKIEPELSMKYRKFKYEFGGRFLSSCHISMEY